MARCIVGSCYLALLLGGLTAEAAAQRPATDPSWAPRTSRAAQPCEETRTVLPLEMETTFSLELPEKQSLQCAVTTQITYTQRNTVARVEATIDHEGCGASDGEIRVVVNVRDESRETKPLEFVQAWRRADDAPVTFEADYPIPENVDLVSVRTRQLRCTCAAAPETPPTTADD